MNKILNKLKNTGELIIKNHLYRLVTIIILVIISAALSPYGVIGEQLYFKDELTVWEVICYVGSAYVIINTLIGMFHTWKNLFKGE
tara:strand:+ start:581 stop:838 length:258 start_codon:yes stop_codon:yes gene_type:complete